MSYKLKLPSFGSDDTCSDSREEAMHSGLVNVDVVHEDT